MVVREDSQMGRKYQTDNTLQSTEYLQGCKRQDNIVKQQINTQEQNSLFNEFRRKIIMLFIIDSQVFIFTFCLNL
jgi:hypothetical protein